MLAPVRPPFDPELDETLKQFPGISLFSRGNLQEVREMLSNKNPTKDILSDSELDHKDITIPDGRSHIDTLPFPKFFWKPSPSDVFHAWRRHGIW
jgi:hypothetical protein